MVEDHPKRQKESQTCEGGEVFGPDLNLDATFKLLDRLNYWGDVFDLTLLVLLQSSHECRVLKKSCGE